MEPCDIDSASGDVKLVVAMNWLTKLQAKLAGK